MIDLGGNFNRGIQFFQPGDKGLDRFMAEGIILADTINFLNLLFAT